MQFLKKSLLFSLALVWISIFIKRMLFILKKIKRNQFLFEKILKKKINGKLMASWVVVLVVVEVVVVEVVVVVVEAVRVVEVGGVAPIEYVHFLGYFSTLKTQTHPLILFAK